MGAESVEESAARDRGWEKFAMKDRTSPVKPPGISVVVCCHNSAERLPPTLAHLAAQQVPEGLDWEVIVVDNASSDETSRVAHAAWPADSRAQFRVVFEPRAGLSNARQCGLDECQYEIVSFIDDDNWICPEWVQTVAEVMATHPEVGACGGWPEEMCEIEPPVWFERFKTAYAVGPQAEQAGVLVGQWACLAGAGMSIRYSAWQQLLDRGFRHILSGRKGASLTSGEDIELMYALRLAGWSLWYEPPLRMRHFIPAGRLQWSYLRRLRRGGGASTVGLDPYSFALLGRPRTLKERVRRTWHWQLARTMKSLLQYRLKTFRLSQTAAEGNPDVLEVEHFTGRLFELMRWRPVYAQRLREVLDTPWTGVRLGARPQVLAAQYQGAAERTGPA
jgi:glycosyltransferase involved in cell wall biosynthesis